MAGQLEHRPSRRGRAAVDHDEQRRTLAVGRLRVRVGRAGRGARGPSRRQRSGTRSARAREPAVVEPKVTRGHEHRRRAPASTSISTTWGSVVGTPRCTRRGCRVRAACRSACAAGRASLTRPKSGSRTANRSRPPSRVRERDPPVGEEAEARLAEHPLRVSRCPCRGRPSTSRPPARGSSGRGSRSRCGRRRTRATRRAPTSGWPMDSRSSAPATTVRVPPSSTTSRVASHGMSGWSHSSQQKRRRPATSADPTRSRDPPRRPRACSARARRGARSCWSPPPVGVVLLLDAQQRGAVRVEVAVGVAQAPGHLGLRGERHRRAARLEAVQALRRPVGEPQHAVVRPPGAAAVLVHRGAGAVLGGQHLVDRAVRPTTQHGDAAAFLGTALRPPHVVAVDADAVGQARRAHHQLARDRGRPRPVRQGRGTPTTCASASRSAMRRQPSPRSSSPSA